MPVMKLRQDAIRGLAYLEGVARPIARRHAERRRRYYCT